jgi:hypothetical protein
MGNKGNGGNRHAPACHQKRRNNRTKFIGGNGCKHHPECFSCPLNECDWGKGHDEK